MPQARRPILASIVGRDAARTPAAARAGRGS
eukprot:COSAG01_NODE_41252_length_453_cov_30.567797_1_plen_30_part_01